MLFWNINNIQATEEPTSLFTLQIIFNIRIKYQKKIHSVELFFQKLMSFLLLAN